MPILPLAYLLTYSTYGTHLPGSAKGYFDPRRPHFGDPRNASHPTRARLESFWQSHLKEPPFQLDTESSRSAALTAILEVSAHRSWQPHAIHVRTTHVHAVITAPACNRHHFWTHHGRTRYLWNKPTLDAALSYVLHS